MNFNLKFTSNHILCNGRKFDRKLIEKIIHLASDPSIKHVVDDGFCGMGGVTAGFNQLPGWIVISCINHWDVAIDTHQKNNPDCLHLLEDFRFADITIIQYLHQEIKRNNPSVKFHLWLSLECTNFSNAKGGMSRDADSRTLADYADRYVIALNPDVIWIENVKEFKLWGPMIPKVVIGEGKKKKTLQFNPKTDDATAFFKTYIDDNDAPHCPLLINKKKKTIGKWMIPEKAKLSQDYNRWKKYICSFGYDKNVGERLLNCADYGVPQHRIRLIMQFNRTGVLVRYPAPTHDKKGRNGLSFWNPVKPCLDLEDEGESVLAFKIKKGKIVPRITSPKTIDRLINGTDKHVLGNKEFTWIVKPNSAKNNTDVSSGSSLNNTSPTLTCFNGLNIAKAHLIDHYFGNGYAKPVSDPAGTTGTKDGIALHTLQFLGTYHSTGDGSSIEKVSPAIMTKDKYPVISVNKFIDHQFSNGQQNKSIDEASGALLQNPKQKIVSVDRFIMDTQYNNKSIELEETIGTITANRKHYYLVNFQWFNQGFSSVDKPSNTLIARQDKSPNYLITLETGELAIEVFKHDPPHYVRLKKYMAENGIISINMRMLKAIEMLRIMTIPEKTKLSKSSTNNKKMIGNAVPSDLIIHLGKAYDNENDIINIKAA